MKEKFRPWPVYSFCVVLLFTGCLKDYTNYYDDQENAGLAIFSDKGNNLMTAYVNNKAWRTHNRITTLFGGIHYELSFYRHVTNGTSDTLFIQWDGDLAANDPSPVSDLTLALHISKTFNFHDLNSLEGQRMTIDGANGYFSEAGAVHFPQGGKGTGNVYFHILRVDSIGPATYTGRMSGLLEAAFSTFSIRRGRFDHDLTPSQFRYF